MYCVHRENVGLGGDSITFPKATQNPTEKVPYKNCLLQFCIFNGFLVGILGSFIGR